METQTNDEGIMNSKKPTTTGGQIDCQVMLRDKIWEHARQHYGAYPNWLIMTGSFYEKLIYELSNESSTHLNDLRELHTFEGARVAVIPRTYGAELTVETAT